MTTLITFSFCFLFFLFFVFVVERCSSLSLFSQSSNLEDMLLTIGKRKRESHICVKLGVDGNVSCRRVSLTFYSLPSFLSLSSTGLGQLTDAFLLLVKFVD
jgi:hypothetical protein